MKEGEMDYEYDMKRDRLEAKHEKNLEKLWIKFAKAFEKEWDRVGKASEKEAKAFEKEWDRDNARNWYCLHDSSHGSECSEYRNGFEHFVLEYLTKQKKHWEKGNWNHDI